MSTAPERPTANRPTSGYAINTPSTEGKHSTRLNAYRHGLTGQIHLFTAEEQKAFDLHCKGIVESLAPVGALELDLAQSVAENRWRLKRVRAIESGIFAAGRLDGPNHAREDAAQLVIDESVSQARTWLAKADNIQLLALYEQRINRTIERTMIELRTLRSERQAALEPAIEQAQLLAQLAHSKGKKYDAAADFPHELLAHGFDFSDAALTRLIARNRRLAEARACAKTPQKPAVHVPAAA